MTDAEVLANMQDLGIATESRRVLALLPLVQVAWADKTLQSGERDTILRIAKKHPDFLQGGGEEILKGWLKKMPTQEYMIRGRRILVELAKRREGIGIGFDEQMLDNIVQFCEEVAGSAGGLFGFAFTVSEEERFVIGDIAEMLQKARGVSWDELNEELS